MKTFPNDPFNKQKWSRRQSDTYLRQLISIVRPSDEHHKTYGNKTKERKFSVTFYTTEEGHGFVTICLRMLICGPGDPNQPS